MSKENQMTIADALTELKRLKKLHTKRCRDIRRYSSKKRGNPDEIEGQRAWVDSQFQSAKDIEERYKRIKLLINESNLETKIEFEQDVFTVAEAILFKQMFYEMREDLLNSFTPDTGAKQVNDYIHTKTTGRGMMDLDNDEREAINLVPELFYEEATILKLKDDNLNLYSFIDALIEKSNHNTVITI